MDYLLDTNILVRLANTKDALHQLATNSLIELGRRRDKLFITPQNLIELRSVATRPVKVNGLGMSNDDVQATINLFETTFAMIEDSPAIYPTWKVIVESLGVIGKQVHDARLVAICHIHQVGHLLTFNVGDFVRFSPFGPGLQIVDPASI